MCIRDSYYTATCCTVFAIYCSKFATYATRGAVSMQPTRLPKFDSNITLLLCIWWSTLKDTCLKTMTNFWESSLSWFAIWLWIYLLVYWGQSDLIYLPISSLFVSSVLRVVRISDVVSLPPPQIFVAQQLRGRAKVTSYINPTPQFCSQQLGGQGIFADIPHFWLCYEGRTNYFTFAPTPHFL